MNFRKIKKITFALTLGLGFTGAPGLSSLSIVQAQVQPQAQPQVQPRPQEKGREQLEKRVTMEERGAFRDGYRKGWQDSRAGRRFDYSNSRLYRMGDREYRDMYKKGYARGYHRERVR
jgi:hypothetical protein